MELAKLEKLLQIVLLTAPDVETENVKLLLENLCLIVQRIVELAVTVFVILQLKTHVFVLKTVATVEMASVMQIEERIKCLVKWIVVRVSVVTVAVLLASQHKLVPLTVFHRLLNRTQSKLLSISLV